MQRNFCGRTRREFLWQAGAGFTGTALAGLLGDEFFARQAVAADGKTPFTNPLEPKPPMHEAKAKAVIFLFMYGGPSQVDTFDEKPELAKLDGKTITVKTFVRGGHKNQGRVVGPKFAFKNYGKCGKRVSDLFPPENGLFFAFSLTLLPHVFGGAEGKESQQAHDQNQ